MGQLGFMPLRAFGTRFILSKSKNRFSGNEIYSELTFSAHSQKSDAVTNRIYHLIFGTRLKNWVWEFSLYALCEHCDRLSQTTCINVVNCKRVTKKCQVFFAVGSRESEFPPTKMSGLKIPPTALKSFTLVLGILDSRPHIVFIILHLWYWCQIFLQKKFCSFVGCWVSTPLDPPLSGG